MAELQVETQDGNIQQDEKKLGVIRIRVLGGAMCYAVYRAADEKHFRGAIQAVSRGEAIKRAKREMPGYTFDVQNIQ